MTVLRPIRNLVLACLVFAAVAILLGTEPGSRGSGDVVSVVPIQMPLGQIIALSEPDLVPTVVEGGSAYAIGFVGGRLFKTEVWRGVLHAHGIRAGRLLFSQAKEGVIGESLMIGDLASGEAQPILPEFDVARAAWGRLGQAVAALVRKGPDVGLVVHDLAKLETSVLRERGVRPEFLRWGEGTGDLYFIEADQDPSFDANWLVQHPSGGQGIQVARIDVVQLPFLTWVSEAQLRAGDWRSLPTDVPSEGGHLVWIDDQLPTTVLRDRHGRVLTLQRVLPLARCPGGFLFEGFDGVQTHTYAWSDLTRDLIRIERSEPPVSLAGERVAAALDPKLAVGQTQIQTEAGLVGAWYLSYPVDGYSAVSQLINSIFDHSVPSGFYSSNRDGKTVAWTGETAERVYGVHPRSDYSDLYKQKSGGDFFVKGYYTGGDWGRAYLSYDGHPGLDLRDPAGQEGVTKVVAPADGTLVVPTVDTVNWNPATYKTFYIDHGNGYSTWFLHCKKGTVKAAGPVKRGDEVARIGKEGPTGTPVHLHFELRKKLGTDWVPVDPYGWEGGCGANGDPYTRLAASTTGS